MTLHTREIRESFLKFFETRGHIRERSSSLVPQNDPTLLFTNAGMVQFKDLFTGQEKRSYSRATTCQKCVRAGGKHNDLESVGFTRRHHTFFEMLGNFSFGNYFKEEAILFAWEFLTKDLQFKSDQLWVSVFENDDEAAALWKKISGLPSDRIVRMGEKDNFWAMGETGPCGPCSEIYVDRGEKFGKTETIFDGGERFLEIWNLVFMQFERMNDGQLKPLPQPSVDTGMGLERLTSVLQNVENNYLIDSMQTILQGFAQVAKIRPNQNEANDVALKVLTDHIRACSFLIADGIQPSNEGRGYVLRRILRRAIRYGKKIGLNRPFFHQGVDFVDHEMGSVYPEIKQNKKAIASIILHEEERFFETLENGLKLIESKMSQFRSSKVVPGEVAFQLYDTFGFPLDLTETIAKENQFSVDHAGFEKELEAQRNRSRASWKGSGEEAVGEVYKSSYTQGLRTEFVGYTNLTSPATVVAVLQKGATVEELKPSVEGEVILDRSPFYAEGGGQAGDQGILKWSGGRFEISDVQKPFKDLFVLKGKVSSGTLRKNERVEASVDRASRLKTRINHSITHVLHAVLQQVLGDHVKQAGSLVRPDYLRFDFTHTKGLSHDELVRIETIINQYIRENHAVHTSEQNLEEAVRSGAKAFFDEKYEGTVRVLKIGDFSLELCGGTHAEQLGEAGLFRISSESSVGSGIRRIVATTGEAARRDLLKQEELLLKVAETLKSSPQDILTKIEKLLKEKNELQKKLLSQSQSPSNSVNTDLVKEINGINILIEAKENLSDAKDLRLFSDQARQRIKTGVVIMSATIEGRTTIICSVTDDLAKKFKMNQLVEAFQNELGTKGGGKEAFAQLGLAGEVNPAALQEIVYNHVKTI